MPDQITEDTLQKLIKLEEQRLSLHVLKHHSRDKEIETNARLAEKTLAAQAEFLKAKPSQDRKTLGLMMGGIIFVIVLFIVFMCYLLHTGNKEFAPSFLIVLTHIAVGAGGYYAGNKASKRAGGPGGDDIAEAEMVD